MGLAFFTAEKRGCSLVVMSNPAVVTRSLCAGFSGVIFFLLFEIYFSGELRDYGTAVDGR
jgi:hypothetical protein